MAYPRSPFDTQNGMVYFPRMLDKMRLHEAGTLPEVYHAFISNGMDARCCAYLHVDYDALRSFATRETNDARCMEWCWEHGRKLSELECFIWNQFATKRGWNDDGSPVLAEQKEASGHGKRDDIHTFFHYMEVEEGRLP